MGRPLRKTAPLQLSKWLSELQTLVHPLVHFGRINAIFMPRLGIDSILAPYCSTIQHFGRLNSSRPRYLVLGYRLRSLKGKRIKETAAGDSGSTARASRGVAGRRRAAPEPENTSDPLLGDSPCCSCLTVGSSWWQREIRYWPEIVAGPRWKTFIRRFNLNQRRGRVCDNNARHYDTLGYKFNFKVDGEEEDDDEAGFGGFRSFSM
ncbi:hypothetical protein Bca52824_017786 [Brassica carinata]|uniref:Uncharacterized protein n=1 Tax=Brassica carinata TaxID=52824 RepID=A0A8X8AVR0_BRACI|nr:hypothetical protein Bca52824_017786 [Brassica carinata]